jgi:GTP-binding protein
MHGKNGADTRIPIPLGTSVSLLGEENEVVQTWDIMKDGEELTLAEGGAGGRGNRSFKRSSNRKATQRLTPQAGFASSLTKQAGTAVLL